VGAGAGAGAGAGSVGSAGSAGSAGEVSSVGGSGGDSGPTSTKEVEKTGGGNQQHGAVNPNMSTQDHMCLRHMSQGSSEVSGAQEGTIDLKKIIEMMMAIKLLEELSKDSQGGGGFSGTA